VQAALDELRDELGTDRVQLGELVVLGARVKVDSIRAERAEGEALRHRLAERVRARAPVADAEAADQVRRTGWARE
jgi:hypothetical protein